MKGPLLLLAHSLKRVRTLMLVMGVLLALFQVFLIIMAREVVQTSKGFAGLAELLPPFMREFLGPALASFFSFGGMVGHAYFHPLVVCSLLAVTLTISTTPTLEIESGFMDLILSRALMRHWIITRTIMLMTICVLALIGTMLLVTWAGLHAFGPDKSVWPEPRLILSLAVNLALLMLCWSGVALAVASASRRRGAAITLVGFLALASLLLDFLARAWRPAAKVAWLSPSYYCSALDLLMGAPLQMKNLLVLAGISVAGFALAYFFFSRRNLRGSRVLAPLVQR